MDNLLGVLVATVAAFAVGMVWYTALFGKRWQALMNYSEGHLIESGAAGTGKGMSMTTAMVGGFVSTFVLVLTLSFIMQAVGARSIRDAVFLGLAVSIGFIATVLANAMWYERRPFELYLINAGHYVVAVVVAALVLLHF